MKSDEKMTCRNCGEDIDETKDRPYCSIECYREKIGWTDEDE